jgi:hypothetical protein
MWHGAGVQTMRAARLLVAAFVVAFVVGFGYGRAVGIPWRGADDQVAGGAGDHRPPVGDSTALPTIPLPPGGRRPTPDEPLRVALAGDSVMAGLAPAVEAALESGGAADVRFVLTPSILRDPTIRFTWERQLEEFDPEVVVMFVGTWESRLVEDESGRAVPMSDPAWRSQYETQVLDPWVELITSGGARVLWIGSPVVANPEANLLFAGLNTVFEALPRRFPGVRYLDSSTVLHGATEGYSPVILGSDGILVRARQVDGLHLCPDGAVLLGREVVAVLVEEWQVPVGSGWEGADWRNDARIFPPQNCPSVN